jgi:phospholipid/cholesterol/gamma-HCH transport system substrate-binding protein
MLLNDKELYNKGLTLLERVDNAMQDLETITAQIKAGEGTAGKLISEQEVYDKLNRAIENMDALMVDIKKNPGRYIKFSLF